MNKYLQAGPGSRSMIETILVLFLLVSLMWALYDVLRVFVGVLTFALIFSVSFAAPFENVVRFLKGGGRLAAFIYSVLLLAIIATPFVFIISAFKNHLREAINVLNEIKTNGLPPLPAWLPRLPLVGEDIAAFWAQLQNSPKETVALHGQQIRIALGHVLTGGGSGADTVPPVLYGITLSVFFLA